MKDGFVGYVGMQNLAHLRTPIFLKNQHKQIGNPGFVLFHLTSNQGMTFLTASIVEC